MVKNSIFEKSTTRSSDGLPFGLRQWRIEGKAPLQAFIDREKSQQSFKEVSNLWTADNNFDASRTAEYVKEVTVFYHQFQQPGPVHG